MSERGVRSVEEVPRRSNAYWTWRQFVNVCTVAELRARRWSGARGASRQGLLSSPARFRKVFVGGCPRSGTTWISSVLNAHPGTLGTAESHAYPHILGVFAELGLCGDAGWRRVLNRYDRTKHRNLGVGLHLYVDRARLCDLIGEAVTHSDWTDQQAAEQVIQGVFDGFFVGRGGTAATLFVEKTPQHLLWAERILSWYPEATLVEVIRDGRDVCVSLEMRGRTQTWAPRDREAQAALWAQYIECGRTLRADPRFRGRVLQVRYEAVKEDQEREIARLFAFVGLETSPDLVARVARATAFERHAKVGPGWHNWRGVVGGWRDHFSADDRALFERVAGNVRRQAGYERE